MAMRAHFAFVGTLALGAAAAGAQSLDHLACAAGVHCSGAVQPDEARIVLGMDDQAEAQRAFIDASRDFPDHVWRCAAAGECTSGMTQNEARVLIPLADDAFAGAEVMRRGQVQKDPPPPAKTPAAAPKPAGRPPVQPPGIEVEANRPGPKEIDLQTPQPAPGGEIQPQDGHWRFTHGSPSTSGKCLPGLTTALAGQMPAPQSGPVAFARPFSASQIIRSPQVVWKRLAPNHWRGTLAASQGKPGQANEHALGRARAQQHAHGRRKRGARQRAFGLHHQHAVRLCAAVTF